MIFGSLGYFSSLYLELFCPMTIFSTVRNSYWVSKVAAVSMAPITLACIVPYLIFESGCLCSVLRDFFRIAQDSQECRANETGFRAFDPVTH